MEQLTLRSRESRVSQAYASLSANIRLRMKQYSIEVDQLKSKVDEDFKHRSMYPYFNFKFFFYRQSIFFFNQTFDKSKSRTYIITLRQSLANKIFLVPAKKLSVDYEKSSNYRAKIYNFSSSIMRVVAPP